MGIKTYMRGHVFLSDGAAFHVLLAKLQDPIYGPIYKHFKFHFLFWQASMQSARNIAFVGAGPAGLTLAHFLLLAGLPFTIFDGEANDHVRSQGGTLDLHEDTGLLALKKGGLWDAYKITLATMERHSSL